MTEEENKIITFLSTKIQEKEWPNINTALDQMSFLYCKLFYRRKQAKMYISDIHVRMNKYFGTKQGEGKWLFQTKNQEFVLNKSELHKTIQ